MKKATKVVEITKEAMVREVEQKFGFKKMELSSLERANKATIALLLGKQREPAKAGFLWSLRDSKCLLSLEKGTKVFENNY